MKRLKLLFTLAIPVLLAQNTQAQYSRLVAQAHWYNNGAVFVPSDTTSYRYDNSARGGDLSHELKYDQADSWSFWGGSYVPTWRYLQSFSTSNDVASRISQQYDTALASMGWKNRTKMDYTYAGTNRTSATMFSFVGGTVWSANNRHLYSYVVSNLTIDLYQVFNLTTNTFEDSKQSIYTYNASNKLIQQLDQDYVGGAWTNTYLYTYGYDTANRVTTFTTSQWTGAWTLQSQFEYQYDGMGNRITSKFSTRNVTGGVWNNTTLSTYSGFTGGMAATELVQTWDTTGGGSWGNAYLWTRAYNSIPQLTAETRISWNVAGSWQYVNGDPANRYYYAAHTSAVNDINEALGTVKVFPIPAQDIINININWATAQSATITIMDMTGAVVRQEAAPVATQYTTMIPVNTLAAGNYIVRVATAQGAVTRQIVINR